MAAGDDCVAIGTDTSNIAVTGVICGPGHGIRFVNKNYHIY